MVLHSFEHFLVQCLFTTWKLDSQLLRAKTNDSFTIEYMRFAFVVFVCVCVSNDGIDRSIDTKECYKYAWKRPHRWHANTQHVHRTKPHSTAYCYEIQWMTDVFMENVQRPRRVCASDCSSIRKCDILGKMFVFRSSCLLSQKVVLTCEKLHIQIGAGLPMA